VNSQFSLDIFTRSSDFTVTFPAACFLHRELSPPSLPLSHSYPIPGHLVLTTDGIHERDGVFRIPCDAGVYSVYEIGLKTAFFYFFYFFLRGSFATDRWSPPPAKPTPLPKGSIDFCLFLRPISHLAHLQKPWDMSQPRVTDVIELSSDEDGCNPNLLPHTLAQRVQAEHSGQFARRPGSVQSNDSDLMIIEDQLQISAMAERARERRQERDSLASHVRQPPPTESPRLVKQTPSAEDDVAAQAAAAQPPGSPSRRSPSEPQVESRESSTHSMPPETPSEAPESAGDGAPDEMRQAVSHQPEDADMPLPDGPGDAVGPSPGQPSRARAATPPQTSRTQPTPRIQTPKATEWTIAKMETSLRTLSRDVPRDHARLLYFTLESIANRKSPGRRNLSSVDVLVDLKAVVVDKDAAGNTMKVKLKVGKSIVWKPNRYSLPSLSITE